MVVASAFTCLIGRRRCVCLLFGLVGIVRLFTGQMPQRWRLRLSCHTALYPVRLAMGSCRTVKLKHAVCMVFYGFLHAFAALPALSCIKGENEDCGSWGTITAGPNL